MPPPTLPAPLLPQVGQVSVHAVLPWPLQALRVQALSPMQRSPLSRLSLPTALSLPPQTPPRLLHSLRRPWRFSGNCSRPHVRRTLALVIRILRFRVGGLAPGRAANGMRTHGHKLRGMTVRSGKHPLAGKLPLPSRAARHRRQLLLLYLRAPACALLLHPARLPCRPLETSGLIQTAGTPASTLTRRSFVWLMTWPETMRRRSRARVSRLCSFLPRPYRT